MVEPSRTMADDPSHRLCYQISSHSVYSEVSSAQTFCVLYPLDTSDRILIVCDTGHRRRPRREPPHSASDLHRRQLSDQSSLLLTSPSLHQFSPPTSFD
ncbi:unnamed protein product [Lactuca virosa]|uniref:Uncharacterized protein n=1 Tax=Lactuca virosa TaxID=75947 RepID=A0AAU9LN43_9ASTR|nr:unnamed protein product [Lactuca virosa]